MSKHTPGPWGVSVAPCGYVYAITQAANEVIRVETKNEANARLIAAAPCLLEAAIHAQHLLDSEGLSLPALDAAIAKAKGEPA